MAGKRKPNKWTAAQIKEHTKKIGALVEKLKRESKHEHFVGISPEELAEKFKRANSPMIVGEAWSPATRGGTLNASITVTNPDPTTVQRLVLHFWVGSGNPDPNVGTFLLNVDPRFPRLSEEQPFGFALASGASRTLSFAMRIPPSVEPSSYMANSCLMRIDFLDQGTYLDRAVLVFAVA